jgi:hypothetical protein
MTTRILKERSTRPFSRRMKARRFVAVLSAVAGLLVCDTVSADDASAAESLVVSAQKTCVSVMPDANRACGIALVAKKCEAGDGPSCSISARLAASWAPRDASLGRRLFARACTLDAAECVVAAYAAFRVYTDAELAHRFLAFGCYRSKDVCRTAAALYVEGKRVPKNDDFARWFAARAAAP